MAGVVACCVTVLLGWLGRGSPATKPEVRGEVPAAPAEATRVEVVHPRSGTMPRVTTQPGSVLAYESVQLYAGVSGFLKSQAVDIGDRVKSGQPLAVLDVPEQETQVRRHSAALEQARAKVVQTKTRVTIARADLEAAQAGVVQAETTEKSKAAELRFREQQLNRMKELLALKSVDERLVDEKTEQRAAAFEAEKAAAAAVVTTKALVTSARAKIELAEADIAEAEAQVKVTQAELDKAQLFVRFATVTAPFDGVITQRNFVPGDFVRAADGNPRQPLLTVQRTDRMRVIVQIPDRDVPYADPGDEAVVEIDALPDEKFPAKIARIASMEDASTRLMQAEIDLPNPQGKIRNGMYGHVTIVLEKTQLLAVPVSCLIGKPQNGKGSVFVVRGGRARQVSVRIASDDGVNIGIVSGVTAKDAVIHHPGGIEDGAPVITD